MRHIGEKNTLCLIGLICLEQCVLQKALFLHLLPCLRIYTPESDYDAPVAVICSGTDNLHLVIFHSALVRNTIIHIIQILFLQFFLKHFLRGGFPHHLPVLFIDEFLYISIQALPHGNLPAVWEFKSRNIILINAKRHPHPRIKVKEVDKIEINGKSMDQFHLALLGLLLSPFLLQLLGSAVQ